jgi:hypothetical protein
MGPSADLCGTPQMSRVIDDLVEPRRTCCVRPSKTSISAIPFALSVHIDRRRLTDLIKEYRSALPSVDSVMARAVQMQTFA